jgi:signal transduction histidine kinase
MPKMSVYTALSRVKMLSGNYALKFLFIAFLGIHIPLLGVIAILLHGRPSALLMLLTTLSCTLVACAATLYVLHRLLEPIQRSFQALKDYLYKRELPHLPTHYPDEAGQLMRKTQLTLQQLDSLLKEKQELAALLSHDIRAPLTNISGLASLISMEDDPGTISFMAGKLSEQVAEQLRFVDDILAKMQQTDRYDRALNPEEVPIKSLVAKVAGTLDRQITAKQLTLSNELPDDLILTLDESQIGHVLQNLFTNAVKFSHNGGLILISAEPSATQVLILVSDQGMGFSAAQAGGLFNPFTAGQAGTAGERSTGIGLYLSKKIMELHGGTIRADSPGIGKGAVFSLVFPLATA